MDATTNSTQGVTTRGLPPEYFRYWGKARPSDPTKRGDEFHLLPFHNLDVAATAHVILSTDAALRSRLARLTGLDELSLSRWMRFLIGAHDIGKFSVGFQSAVSHVAEILQPGFSPRASIARHDTLGDVLWRDVMIDWALDEDLLALGVAGDGRLMRMRWRETLAHWVAATSGHHGQPPRPLGPSGMPLRAETAFHGRDLAAARTFVSDLAALPSAGTTARTPLDPVVLARAIPRASWLIAGLTVLADWIGSDETRFPYKSTPMPLAQYWNDHALPQAETAVRRAGIRPSAGSISRGVPSLFPQITKPSPVQRWAESVSIPAVPTLFIIEDATGSGKTEAALTLAHRLMGAGGASGAFIGLPTMATANAMFDRVLPIAHQMFGDGEQPSVTVAHGRRKPSRTFDSVAIRDVVSSSIEVSDQDVDAKFACSAWIADSNKKSLLAHVGVGTIDQALLGVIPVRHQSLRLLGLAGKVLVVDEVHAYDPYVNRLIEHLLRFHIMNGGHVILLSATLPRARRTRLVRIYRECVGASSCEVDSFDYPLVTVASGENFQESACESRAGTERAVRVVTHENAADLADVLARAAREGRAVCWIRNTVRDAVAGQALLAERLPQMSVALFHARFALCDRLAIESGIVGAVGKESSQKSRALVVVATQVVEQSLDLDFDVMATDLAPIDLIIQRAGRLHRHARRANGDPRSDGPDERGPAVLHVLAPRWSDVAGPEWYASRFPGAARVYPDHGKAWLTLRALREREGFTMPRDARELVEAVYGDSAFDTLPTGLQRVSLEAEGAARADVAQGALTALDPDAGYRHDAGTWGEETRARTRLGEPTIDVYLARWDGSALEPWAGDAGWSQSVLSVRRGLAKEAGPVSGELDRAITAANGTLPGRGRYGFILPLTRAHDDTWIGEAVSESGTVMSVRYHERRGLEIEG